MHVTTPVPRAGDYLLFVIPTADTLFRRLAVLEIESVRSGRRRLQAARLSLRTQYRRAELHRQRDILVEGARTEAWFAFRDGRNSPACPPGSWWSESGLAAATVGATGRFTRANRAFRANFGMSSALSTRSRLPDALAAELSPGASGTLPSTEVTSLAVVESASVTPTDIEFHTSAADLGPQGYHLTVRTFHERDAAIDANAIGSSSLGELSPSQCRALVQGARTKQLAQGERLPESIAGDPWVGLTVCGIVRVYVATDVLEPTVLYARHGSLLGTQRSFGDDAPAFGLQAVTPTRIMQLDPGRVGRLLGSEAGFANAVAADGRLMLRNAIQSYAMRTSKSLTQRIAREILLIGDLQGEDSLVPVTEQQLADGVGSPRESVARAIGDLRQRGLVATTRYGVMPVDADALAVIAESFTP